jgi:hypothetical protein
MYCKRGKCRFRMGIVGIVWGPKKNYCLQIKLLLPPLLLRPQLPEGARSDRPEKVGRRFGRCGCGRSSLAGSRRRRHRRRGADGGLLWRFIAHLRQAVQAKGRARGVGPRAVGGEPFQAAVAGRRRRRAAEFEDFAQRLEILTGDRAVVAVVQLLEDFPDVLRRHNKAISKNYSTIIYAIFNSSAKRTYKVWVMPNMINYNERKLW